MQEFSPEFKITLARAVDLAERDNHVAIDIQHLVLAMLDDKDASSALKACFADLSGLRRDLVSSLTHYAVSQQNFISAKKVTSSYERAIERARRKSELRLREQVTGLDLLEGLIGDDNTFASKLFSKRRVVRSDIIDHIYGQTHLFPLGAGPTQQDVVDDGSTPSTQVGAVRGPLIPHQTAAPVRVEERSGKLTRASDRNSTVDAVEVDFDHWRAPVLESLSDLLDTDLRPGTNHDRLRRRLLALAAALAGTIDDVKANQFRLGYGVEGLGDLVNVYRNAADDMPTLNAAVFADVNRLHIQLMLGLSKLVAWSRFQREADADELHEGTAEPAAVGAALAEAEAVLSDDAAAPIVDPELPRSFRWIREAIADPLVTTKRMIYGAVKSLENVGVFLGQLSLRTAKEAIEGTAQQIGKRTSAALLIALSGALLHLSGALPTAWPWLKPLLEAAAKVVGG